VFKLISYSLATGSESFNFPALVVYRLVDSDLIEVSPDLHQSLLQCIAKSLTGFKFVHALLHAFPNLDCAKVRLLFGGHNSNAMKSRVSRRKNVDRRRNTDDRRTILLENLHTTSK